MRISDWSSDVCSSDLRDISHINHGVDGCEGRVSWITWRVRAWRGEIGLISTAVCVWSSVVRRSRSEEHTSELQSLMRISYAVFCLKIKTTNNDHDLHSLTPAQYTDKQTRPKPCKNYLP